MIEFNCPDCQKTLRTQPEKAGAKAKCPSCGKILTVPSATSSPTRPPKQKPKDELGELPDDEFGGFGDDHTSSPTKDEFWGDGDEFGGQTRRKRSSRENSGFDRQKECPMCGEMTSTRDRHCEHCGETLKRGEPSYRSRRRGYDFDYAGFWLRFVANFIDGILIFVVLFVLFFAIGMVFAAGGPGNNPFDEMEGMFQIIGMVIAWLYFAGMESSESQATLGKQLLGIIVTNENGERLSFLHATGRHFAKIISNLSCLIGYIMAGVTERKQALHDLIASTLVVRRD